ncbi:hypothetical protein GCM10020216_000730 [Nonomuraea helvata]
MEVSAALMTAASGPSRVGRTVTVDQEAVSTLRSISARTESVSHDDSSAKLPPSRTESMSSTLTAPDSAMPSALAARWAAPRSGGWHGAGVGFQAAARSAGAHHALQSSAGS